MFRNISPSEKNKSSLSELFNVRRGQSLLLLVALSSFVLLLAPAQSHAEEWSDMPCDQHQSPQSGVRDRTLWQRIADNYRAAARNPMPTAAELANKVLFYVDKEANDRLRVVDPQDDPMLSAVGRAYFTDDDGKRYSAVATLLNDCKVLISAHLTTPIEDRSRSSIGKRIEFEFKHNGSLIKPAGEVIFNSYHSSSLIPHIDEEAIDHAIVDLPNGECNKLAGVLPALLERDLSYVSPARREGKNPELFLVTYRGSFGRAGDDTLKISVPEGQNVHLKESCTRVEWSKLPANRSLGFINCSTIFGSSAAPLFRVAEINGQERMIVLATVVGSPSEEIVRQLADQNLVETIQTSGRLAGIRSVNRVGGKVTQAVGNDVSEVSADTAVRVSPFLNLGLMQDQLPKDRLNIQRLLVPRTVVN